MCIRDRLRAEDLLPKDTGTDRSKLDDIFAKYQAQAGGNTNGLRAVYTAETYDQYFVPTWQDLYRAYTYAGATQEQIDEALAAAQDALGKLESVSYTHLDVYKRQGRGFCAGNGKYDHPAEQPEIH